MEPKVFELSDTLKVSVQKGDYGRFIKVFRKDRWIGLSPSLWRRIDDNKKRLRHVGYVQYLTKVKRLECVAFNDERYVTLVEHKPDSEYKNFINFNDKEWDSLLNQMESIKNALVDCTECQNLKRPLVVDKETKRMGETSLPQWKVRQIEEYNVTVQNQEGIVCLYCGDEIRDGCHCHKYDCKICEPQNFCFECDSMKVYVPRM